MMTLRTWLSGLGRRTYRQRAAPLRNLISFWQREPLLTRHREKINNTHTPDHQTPHYCIDINPLFVYVIFIQTISYMLDVLNWINILFLSYLDWKRQKSMMETHLLYCGLTVVQFYCSHSVNCNSLNSLYQNHVDNYTWTIEMSNINFSIHPYGCRHCPSSHKLI